MKSERIKWLLIGAAIVGWGTTYCPAQVNKQPPKSIQSISSSKQLDQLVTHLVLENMPHSYTRNKDWGKQEQRWDGIEWRREGWKIETKRKKKLVNHGTWRKYSAELLDPANQFSVEVKNIRQTENKQLAFEIAFDSWLRLHARQSKWLKGVQLYSFSAEGKAKVRLRLSVEMDILLDPSRLPPDIVFRPAVSQANLQVDEFRIDRVSKLGGEFAQQVTRARASRIGQRDCDQADGNRRQNQQADRKECR